MHRKGRRSLTCTKIYCIQNILDLQYFLAPYNIFQNVFTICLFIRQILNCLSIPCICCLACYFGHCAFVCDFLYLSLFFFLFFFSFYRNTRNKGAYSIAFFYDARLCWWTNFPRASFDGTSHHESFFDRCLVSSQYTRSCSAKIGLFTEMESFLHLTRGLKATDHVLLILPRPQLLFLSPMLVENSLHRCHLDHLKNQLRGKMCCDYNLVTLSD